MREFKIMDVIRRWWIIIMVVSLIGEFVFNWYINGKQTYTARTMISYISKSAASGKTPADTDINLSEITSSNVVQDALDALGYGLSLESVRSHISVTPVISDDEETRKAAILDDGLEYEFFPTEYIVSFEANSDQGPYFARRVLDAVLDSYFKYYCRKYVNVETYPNSFENALNAEFDYIESVEIIDSSLTNLLGYLTSRAASYPNYRSSITGYNFNGLLMLYQNLYDINVYSLYADVLGSALTKDVEILKHKYATRILNNQLNIDSLSEKSAAIQKTIDSYIAKSATRQEALGESQQDGTGENNIINFVSDINNANKVTTYDAMIYDNVDYKVQMKIAQIDNEFYELILQRFSDNAEKNTPEARRNIEARLEYVVDQSKTLYAILVSTVAEFNEYLATQNVVSLSSIQVVTGINVNLYLLIAFVLFVLVGCVGAVALGYLSKMVRSFIFVDARTGLPNRISCDRIIDSFAHEPLPADTSICVIDLDNLITTNERKGREYGDAMLKNIGIIIASFAKSYGVIGYNGGSTFFGLFQHCDKNKGQLFISSFRKAIESYNRQFPENAMFTYCVVNEAQDTGIYDVRELLKRTLLDVRTSKSAERGQPT